MAKRGEPKWKKGVIALPREMIESPAYRDLPCTARCLIVELQNVWNPTKNTAVHFSNRRAQAALKVGPDTASKAFHSLLDSGFIKLSKESDLIQRKAAEYRLTWLKFNGCEPTNEWRKNGTKK